MKKSIWFLIATLLVTGILFAQDDYEIEVQTAEEIQAEAMESVNEAMEDVAEALEEIDIIIDIPESKRTTSDAFMGVYTKEITLAKAAELEYNEFYGVLITGVTDDTPAYYFRLVSNDILMQIDDIKIKGKSHFNRVLSPYRVGDQVNLKIFRNGKVMDIPFVFGSRYTKFSYSEGKVLVEQEQDEIIKENKKRRLNAGDGGIGWTPTWYMGDVKDLNMTFEKLGLTSGDMLDEDGFLLGGFAFQGDIGKNWFVGFQHNSFDDTKKSKIEWTIDQQTSPVDAKVKWSYDYEHWGFSFDRRFAITKNFVSSVGFMFGFAEQEIKYKRTYTMSSVEEQDFNQDLDDAAQGNYTIKHKQYYEKDHIVAEPRVMLMWHPIDWFGIRVQAGYLTSYSSKGWKVKVNGDSVDYLNEPDDSLDGLTLSVGPWFGF